MNSQILEGEIIQICYKKLNNKNLKRQMLMLSNDDADVNSDASKINEDDANMMISME